MTRDDILATLREASPELRREFGVRRLALFGSFARGEAGPDSDVDILVDFDPSLGLRFVDLADRLEMLVGRRADVVSFRAVPRQQLVELAEELVDVA